MNTISLTIGRRCGCKVYSSDVDCVHLPVFDSGVIGVSRWACLCKLEAAPVLARTHFVLSHIFILPVESLCSVMAFTLLTDIVVRHISYPLPFYKWQEDDARHHGVVDVSPCVHSTWADRYMLWTAEHLNSNAVHVAATLWWARSARFMVVQWMYTGHRFFFFMEVGVIKLYVHLRAIELVCVLVLPFELIWLLSSIL